MEKKSILFDFDGTIADSIPWIFKEINNHASEYGFEPIPSEKFEALRSSTLPELVKQFNISLFKLPFFIAMMRREVKKDIDKMGLCAGMKELLLALQKKGYRMGVVSSSPKENIEAFLLRHDLKIFEFIHSELNIFGKSAALEGVMREHNMKKEETIYVGDEIRDIEACKAIELDVISVTWGFSDEEGLRKHGATHLAKKPEDIAIIANSF
ncbi:HAD-IA family hydrolase [Candidatus Roizmanbacteria bacterium]|nr:HAD-IA family hydrolase [Candidatus Roizmanbacteria bacterium]